MYCMHNKYIYIYSKCKWSIGTIRLSKIKLYLSSQSIYLHNENKLQWNPTNTYLGTFTYNSEQIASMKYSISIHPHR